jgi:hypothetical protein
MSEIKAWNVDVSNLDKPDQRAALVFLARTAETAERYDDMARLMRQLVQWTTDAKVDLTIEERNLLSVAYKNVIGARRASWRTLSEEQDESKFNQLVQQFKKQVEKELESICAEVLDLLENYLVKNADVNQATDEAKVFYLKMSGDYWRYRAESASEGSSYDVKSAEYYKKAFTIAERTLEPTHPIRLGLALNYSVCFYEILKKPKEACELAKSAFDLAISKLDKLKEADYKDSTLIMQLLRDNLTLWTTTGAGGEGGDGGGEGGGDVAVEDLDD